MQTKNILFALASSAMIMGACNKAAAQTQNDDKPNNFRADTVRVIGVYTLPNKDSHFPAHIKYFDTVDKKGKPYRFEYNTDYPKIYDNKTRKSNFKYDQRIAGCTERGDTLLIRLDHTGIKIVQNLTQERLKNEFVNGR